MMNEVLILEMCALRARLIGFARIARDAAKRHNILQDLLTEVNLASACAQLSCTQADNPLPVHNRQADS
jgi:hypothetical protein